MSDVLRLILVASEFRDRGSPEGNRSKPRYFDGTEFTPEDAITNAIEEDILKLLFDIV